MTDETKPIDTPELDRIGFNYTPRSHFVPYHMRTQRYAVIVAHRRSGKTYSLLNDIIVRGLVKSMDGLRQQFALMAPTQSQARSISWAYLKEQTACFAHCKGYKSLEQHLTVILPDPRNPNLPGTTIMLVGAENAERLRGIYLNGIVIDEAADIPEYVISTIIRPALADRAGWLTVSGTVKSIDDFLWTTYERALKLPLTWFAMNLKASESGILSPMELADLRASMTEESYEVEFENNVKAATTGKIFLPYIVSKQVTKVPYDPAGSAPFTAWDLGVSDSTAIWVLQLCGREVHSLDAYQESGKGLDHFVDWLRKREYAGRFGAHLLPHDSRVRELGSGGKSRVESLREMGLRNLKVVPKLTKDQQIEAGRQLLARAWFNQDTTIEGMRALRNYKFQYDQKRQVFSLAPVHDKSCLIAGTLIETERGDVPIEDVVVGDKVVTPSGFGEVMFSGAVKRADTLIEITLADGRTLTGTPEHFIFTYRGLVALANIRKDDMIFEGKSFLWRLFKRGAKKIFLHLHTLAA